SLPLLFRRRLVLLLNSDICLEALPREHSIRSFVPTCSLGGPSRSEACSCNVWTVISADESGFGARLSPRWPGFLPVGPNKFVGSRSLHYGRLGTENACRRPRSRRSEEHTSELQSRENLVCRLLLEKKKYKRKS